MGDVTLSISDGQLGTQAPPTDHIPLLIGVSSTGTVGTPQTFSDVGALRAALGTGPLVEAAAYLLAYGGGTVRCSRIVGTGVSLGSVTKSNGSSPTMTVDEDVAVSAGVFAGKSNDTYSVKVRVTKTGALAAGMFRVSLDGGVTEGGEVVLAATYVIPGTNIELTFPTGTYTAGDTYTFEAAEPTVSASDITTALTSCYANPVEWSYAHLVSRPASGSATRTIADAVATSMATAESSHKRYVFALVDPANDTDSNLATAFSNFVSTRVGTAGGYVTLSSPIDGRSISRPATWPLAARIAAIPVSEHPGRVATGPVLGLSESGRDERLATTKLAEQRFSTLQTYPGRVGTYITKGCLMAGEGSDYASIQNRRVMDKACATAYSNLLTFLNSAVRVNANGTVYEQDAIRIETYVANKLEEALVNTGDATATTATVKRTTNIVSTSRLDVTVRVRPLGYAEFIAVDIGFDAPATVTA